MASMLASGPWYESGTFWGGAGAVAAFAAIVVSVVLWRLGAPSRVLTYDTPVATPLISDQWHGIPGELQVTLDERPIGEPYLVVLRIDNKSRRDIRSSDFDQGRPLVADFGVPLIGASWDGTATIALESVRPGEAEISVGPALIPGGQGLRLILITDGEPMLIWQSPLVGVKVREQSPADINWRGNSIVIGTMASTLLFAFGAFAVFGSPAKGSFATGVVMLVLSVVLLIIINILSR
jgi:hypothetical protein